MAADGWGDRLRAHGRKLGLSDSEIARRLDIPQRRYSTYVNMTREPNFAELVRICAVLVTTPDEILGVKSPDPESTRGRRALAVLERLSPERLDTAVEVLEALATVPSHVGRKQRETAEL